MDLAQTGGRAEDRTIEYSWQPQRQRCLQVGAPSPDLAEHVAIAVADALVTLATAVRIFLRRMLGTAHGAES
jgi:hypothetical protein